MKKLLILVVSLCCSIQVLKAQTVEEERLKKIARLETESFFRGDTATWKSLFIQDDKTIRTQTGSGYYISNIGWNSFAPASLAWIKEQGKALQFTIVDHSNYIIRRTNDMAWISFNQTLTDPSNDSLVISATREFRTLVKENYQWKISSIITFDTLSFNSTAPQVVEGLFNTTGHNFLNEKKIDQAIEIFKFNIKMYPNAWNAYNSLAEAYEIAGNKKLAIVNYEKAVQLNPKNENGKAKLIELKKTAAKGKAIR
jgi:tetratricopeptide (TPR) repeat protein